MTVQQPDDVEPCIATYMYVTGPAVSHEVTAYKEQTAAALHFACYSLDRVMNYTLAKLCY